MTKQLLEREGRERWWVWVQNLLTVAALVLAPISARESNKALIVVGAALYLAGAIIGVMAVRELGRNRSPHPRPLTGSILVQSGIYSVMRHPLYSSLILVTFGWALAWNSLPTLLVTVALAILLDQKARLEERYITKRFPEYREYAAQVSRFVPGLY
jgi:protein-S-isoprenylcysteine O-methyltransferase Ste14